MARSCVLARRLRDDDGMTLLEVAIAASILLFALTALLGLLSASTMMTAKAKTETVAVNQANSVIEKIRAESFPSLTQAKVNAVTAANSGKVGNVKTVVTGALTPVRVSGVPTSSPPSYYKLEVTVVATGVGRPVTFVTSTYIRRWRMTSETASSQVKPTVAFTSVTPAQSEIVWGDKQVGANANSNMSGVPLIKLGIYGRGTPIVETTATLDALSVNGIWRTTNWPEGAVALTAEARDSLQLSISSRSVIVDNLPPSTHPTPTLEAVTTTNTVVWRWDAVLDGDPVEDYAFTVYKQNPNNAGFTDDPAIVTPSAGNGIQRKTILTTSFSRYYVSVRGRGPREIHNGGTGSGLGYVGTSGIYISRPSVSGSTCNIVDKGSSSKKATFNAVLRCDAPTFENLSSDGTYHWSYKYGTFGWTSLPTTATPYVSGPSYATPTITAPVNGSIADYPIQFRCLINITPSGTGTPVYVPSSIVRFEASNTGAATQISNSWAKWDTSSWHAHPITWSSWSL